MKNICIFIAIVLVLLCSLCSCADPSSEPGDTPLENPGTDPLISETEPVTEAETQYLPAEIDDIRAAFYTYTNENGSYASYERESGMLGGLPPPEIVPAYEQRENVIGEKTAIRLVPMEYLYKFAYFHNESGEERLLVFLHGDKVPMMICFSLEVGGSSGLIQEIREGAYIPVTVVDAVNYHETDAFYAMNCMLRDEMVKRYPELGPIYHSADESQVRLEPEEDACLGSVYDQHIVMWNVTLPPHSESWPSATEPMLVSEYKSMFKRADRYGLQY